MPFISQKNFYNKRMRIPKAISKKPAKISTSFREANTASTTPSPNPAQQSAQQLQSKNCFIFFIASHRPFFAFVSLYAVPEILCASLFRDLAGNFLK